MGILIFSKVYVVENSLVQEFQEIKHGCSHLTDSMKNGSTGNATGAPTKT